MQAIKQNNVNTTTSGCTVCFDSLGIGSRMSIYRFLKQNGSRSVSDIVDFVGLTQPTVSYHLNEMKLAGILKSERRGKAVYYMVNDECKVFHQACVLKDVKFPG